MRINTLGGAKQDGRPHLDAWLGAGATAAMRRFKWILEEY
jgi:hypothetical protein